ncbi:hypothetical protein FSP39_008977 [Pinctada imbricata]|uniref:Uncharacterized protein n=1 Tax=Pinctada imbricata TaxID=66713 RepID=A0AA88Y3Y0_PINIB|nr:hypothetical protein FSP39_008977 [Pinctada imbricata]
MKRFTEDVEKWINKQRSILESQKQKKILIVEGFRMLAYKPLAQLFDKKYFITISEAVCKERRRVYVPPDVPGYMDKVVWPEYLNHLRELKQETNIEYIDGTEDQDAVKEKILQNIFQFLDTKISNI